MNLIRMSIDDFAVQLMTNYKVTRITSDWQLEPAVIRTAIVSHFRSLGILYCEINQDKLLTETAIFFIQHSPQLARLLHDAKASEARRRTRSID